MFDEGRRSISEFYAEDALLYADLAQDRDFVYEAEALCAAARSDACDRRLRFVDLFAGPALHAIAVRESGNDAYALDASPAMARLALERGLPADHYFCEVLPSGIAALPPECDVLFAGRYSAGYLDRAEVIDLLRSSRDRLSDRGSVIFELHRAEMIHSQFADLDIRDRQVRLPDGRSGMCRWPASMKWIEGSNSVAMSVDIMDEQSTSVRLYRSVEHMHIADDLAQAARSMGFARCEQHSALFERVFPQSDILHLCYADV